MTRYSKKSDGNSSAAERKRVGKKVQRTVGEAWLELQEESQQNTAAQGLRWLNPGDAIVFRIDNVTFTCIPGEMPKANPRLTQAARYTVERVPGIFAEKAKEALQARIAELNPALSAEIE